MVTYRVISPFIWDLDLGITMSHSFGYMLVPSLQMDEEGEEECYTVEKQVECTVGFGTRTNYYLATKLTAREFSVLNVKLALFKEFDSPTTVREGMRLNDLWNWTLILNRLAPIVPFDQDIISQVLTFLKPVPPPATQKRTTTRKVGTTAQKPTGSKRGGHLKGMSGSVTFLFGTPESYRGIIDARRLAKDAKRTCPDTLLPTVKEHRTGVRVYPYTRSQEVLKFYSATKTDVSLVSFEDASTFITDRQIRSRLYLSRGHKKTAATMRSPPLATETDKRYNKLNHVPPPVCFSDNIFIFPTGFDSTTITKTSSPPSQQPPQLTIQPRVIFKHKTGDDKMIGFEFRRIYVRDQSQYVLGVEESPALMGDFGGGSSKGGTTKRGVLGSEDQVRFVLDLNKYPDITSQNLSHHLETPDQLTYWSAYREDIVSAKLILEDFRHKLNKGCHGGFGQLGSPLYASLDFSEDYAREMLTFQKDTKSHKCHLEDTEGVQFEYLTWGSKIHRARMVEDLDICDNIQQQQLQQQQPRQPVSYKKDAYLFFVDNAPQIYGTGFKRFTECHLYSLISKYLFKYNVIIGMIEVIEEYTRQEPHIQNVAEISVLEVKLRNVLHKAAMDQKARRPKHHITDDRGATCFANYANASKHKCAILHTKCGGDMSLHYKKLIQRDLYLKKVLRQRPIIFWILRNAKICNDLDIKLPEQHDYSNDSSDEGDCLDTTTSSSGESGSSSSDSASDVCIKSMIFSHLFLRDELGWFL